ncbi:MAG: FAD binding domain-containing protein [Anaerolineae bacterium]|nr:FAD binding domain-containing protein [Anaerolineae bacterium]
MQDFAYTRPQTLDEALALLNEPGVRARILAGGTDLAIEIRQGRIDFDRVVDIKRLPELKIIDLAGDRITLGAGVTFGEILDHPTLSARAPLLVQACRRIASVPIRNRGTLGGNVVNAAACADSLVVLIALDADAHIVAPGGDESVMPVAALVTGPNRTRLPAGALVRAFSFAPPPDPGRTVFLRVGRRQAMVIARLALAALGALDQAGRIVEVRLVPGAAFSPIRRMPEVESMLVGQTPGLALFAQAAHTMEDLLRAESGGRWSSAYKQPVLAALTARALHTIFGEQQV